MADAQPIPVAPPKEAVDRFQSKGFTLGYSWQDVWQEEHGRSFTVAKAMTRDVLETIRAEVDAAIVNGTTLETFKANLTPTLQKLGWWGRKEVADPLTGEVKTVQLGSPARLKTIFAVNTRASYQAGRWDRIERQKKVFPFLRYVSVMDGRERPQHHAWHGTIKPVDDPWWDTHYGPCGWNCRCTAIAYNARQLAKNGWEVTDEPPAFPVKAWVNGRTGEVSDLEEGIDAGWSYNVGKSRLSGLAPAPLPPAPGDRKPPAARPMRANGAAELKAFFKPFGMEAGDVRKGKVFTDRGGWPLAMSFDWFKRNGETVMPQGDVGGAGETIVDPHEIWWSWGRGANGAAVLMRRYVTLDGIGRARRVVDVGRDGWTVDHGDLDLDTLRKGKLAWKRKEPTASEFAQAAIARAPGAADHRIGAVPDTVAGRLRELGLKVPKSVGLEAGFVRHIHRRHSADARGQKPIRPEDIARALEIVAAGKINHGNPKVSKSGAPRIFVTATIGSDRYSAAFEVRKYRLILASLRRR